MSREGQRVLGTLLLLLLLLLLGVGVGVGGWLV
jgi:hypothetical protein